MLLVMGRVIVIAAVLLGLLLGASTAQARLRNPEARRVMTGYLAELQERGENEGFAVNDCHRYSKDLIWCHVVEYGVELEGFGVGTMYYRMKAKAVKKQIILSAAPWGQLEKPGKSSIPTY